MSSNLITLEKMPMPYMTECSIKRFSINEYHCARYTKHFVLIFMMRNRLTFEENGVQTTLEAGEWYIQQKGMYQTASTPSSAAEYLFIHFTAEICSNAFDGLTLPKRGIYDRLAFDIPLRELHRFANQASGNPFEVQQRFLSILGMLHETLSASQTLADQILQFIQTHYRQRITSKSLAEEFAYSTEYIERQVKAASGMTPHAYLNMTRLKHARRQLERSNIPIAQICDDCGFTDASLFFRAFKKEFGQSPSAWRKSTRAFDMDDMETSWQ